MKYFSATQGWRRNLRPPDLYEYFVDNFWFRTVDFEEQDIGEPLRGSHEADVVIVGGGYMGLSTAYHVKRRFPEKKILIVEGARCGYGASGRNGGFCVTDVLLEKQHIPDDQMQDAVDVSFHGFEQIKHLVDHHGVDCDFAENGMLSVALDESQVGSLEEYAAHLKSFGLESTFVEGPALGAEIRSQNFVAGLTIPYGATLNPAKLVRGMKRVVEEMGVEIRERSVVTRISPGRVHEIETELGRVRAPTLVIGLNAYSHKLGFFRDRVFPMAVHQVATAPLSPSQWDSIGWANGQGLSDMRPLYGYAVPTADGRIVMGGVDFTYYDFDALSSGNDQSVTRRVVDNLFAYFPQLEGLEIEHTWSGTTAYTLNGRIPSVGVMGGEGNIYYGVGFSNGVPSAQTAGRIIADLMAGESNKFTNHFITNRTIPWAGPKSLRGLFGRAYKWKKKNYG